MFHTTHMWHERREGAHVRIDKITPPPAISYHTTCDTCAYVSRSDNVDPGEEVLFDPAIHTVDWAPSPDDPGALLCLALFSCSVVPSSLPISPSINRLSFSLSLSLSTHTHIHYTPTHYAHTHIFKVERRERELHARDVACYAYTTHTLLKH